MRDILIVGCSSTLLLPTNNHPAPPPPLPPTTTTTPKSYTNKHRSPAKLSSSSSFSRPPLLLKSFDSKSSSPNYYGGLASKLAHEGKLEEFVMIAETVLVSDPSSVFVASLNIKLVSLGISTLISDDRLELVIGFMDRIQKLGISPSLLFDKSVTKLLAFKCRALVKTHKLKEAVDFMETLAGFHFSIKEFVKPYEMLKLCIQKSDPDTAVRYACMLPNAPNLFSSIILEFGKKGDLSSSVIAYEASKCKSDGPNMYACRTMIDVCALFGDIMKSRCIYEGLRAENVIPNTYVYNSLMNVNAHDLSYALRVFKHMKYLGVVPDLASYNILLKACCRAGRVDLAKNIYEEARHIASMGKLKLDVITYSTIIKVFADAKMWQMALKIKEDMLSAGVTPNVITWSSLISACANVGLVEEATEIFKEMLHANCEPNTQCCNNLLHACVEACQYDRAFRTFQSWRKSDFQNSFHTINYNFKGQASQSRENSSENGKMVSFTPTIATFNILMKACGTDYYRAKALMDEIRIAGLLPNNITWSIFIDICGNTGNVRGSVQALEAMHNTGLKPDVVAYTTAIKACVKNKSLKIAFSLFEEMKRYRVKPNLVTYKTILRARRRYGSVHDVQQCLAIYQDMRKAGYSPNDYFLKELIEEWCEGVITDKSLEKGIVGQSHSHDHIDKETRQNVLLEKVAEHLERDISQNLVVDLRGLTKVEARIVVLAVLRMIKENYTKGDPLEDDIVIILGAWNELTGVVNHICPVQDAVSTLLHNELGLKVVGPRLSLIRNDVENPLERDISCRNLEKIGIDIGIESSPRRPAMLRRLRVTRKSLYHWLQRVDVIRK